MEGEMIFSHYFSKIWAASKVTKRGLKGSVTCIQARGLIPHLAGHSCDENNVAAAWSLNPSESFVLSEKTSPPQQPPKKKKHKQRVSSMSFITCSFVQTFITCSFVRLAQLDWNGVIPLPFSSFLKGKWSPLLLGKYWIHYLNTIWKSCIHRRKKVQRHEVGTIHYPCHFSWMLLGPIALIIDGAVHNLM